MLLAEKRATGTFEVRPVTRHEVRAPVAGFLKEIPVSEGDEITAAMLVARIDVPELESNIAQKQAEIAEAQAKLKLLKTGTREEESKSLSGSTKRSSNKGRSSRSPQHPGASRGYEGRPSVAPQRVSA